MSGSYRTKQGVSGLQNFRSTVRVAASGIRPGCVPNLTVNSPESGPDVLSVLLRSDFGGIFVYVTIHWAQERFYFWVLSYKRETRKENERPYKAKVDVIPARRSL